MSIFRDPIYCDLYSSGSISSKKLRFLSLYDKSFEYKEGACISGYFGVKVDRISLVRIIVDLRSEGFNCLSIPMCYKTSRLLTVSECLNIGRKYASNNNISISEIERMLPDLPFCFNFDVMGGVEERAGGIVRVDKLDGHIWTLSEVEEYMHDYNGLLI